MGIFMIFFLCTSNNCVTKEKKISHNVEMNDKGILLFFTIAILMCVKSTVYVHFDK